MAVLAKAIGIAKKFELFNLRNKITRMQKDAQMDTKKCRAQTRLDLLYFFKTTFFRNVFFF